MKKLLMLSGIAMLVVLTAVPSAQASANIPSREERTAFEHNRGRYYYGGRGRGRSWGGGGVWFSYGGPRYYYPPAPVYRYYAPPPVYYYPGTTYVVPGYGCTPCR